MSDREHKGIMPEEDDIAWEAEVQFTWPNGREETVTDTYYQPRKPAQTKIVTDLVPKGCTTNYVSVHRKM